MKNYSNEANTPYGGYRGAATAQPLDAPNDLPESSPEGYHPPFEGANQQQQQFFYGSQQRYEYQQPYFAPPAGIINSYERTSMGMRARTAGWLS